MQHQSFAAKQWIGHAAPNLERLFGSDVSSHHDVQPVAVAGVGHFLASSRAEGLLFTLRKGSFLSSEPSYDSKTRLSLAIGDVLVASPPLEEKGEFCHYRLVDGEGLSLIHI